MRGLFAAGSPADLDDDVAIVVGVAGQELETQLGLQGRFLRFELSHDLTGKIAQLWVALRVALTSRRRQLLTGATKLAVAVHDGRQLGLFASQQLAALRVGGDLRSRPLGLDLL